MNPVEFEKSLAQKEFFPLYFFLSEEPFLGQRCIERLHKALQEKKNKVELLRYNVEEGSLDRLLSELGAYSFFTPHQLIQVERAERLKKGDLEKLIQSQRGNSLCTLVFITGKKEIYREGLKILGSEGLGIECSSLKLKDIPPYLISFAKEEGKSLSPAGVRLLIDLIGTDLFVLRNQMTLLSLFVGEKKEIAAEDIQNLFLDTAEKDVFLLSQSLSQGDKAQAFSLLKHLLVQGEIPLRLLGLLVRHYRLLFKAKLLLKKGTPSKEIAQVLRLFPFVAEKYIQEAQALSWKKGIKIYRALSQTDRALKSSSLPPVAILEKCLWVCLET